MRSTYQRKVDKKQIPTCNIMGVNIAAINMEWLLEYLDKNLDIGLLKEHIGKYCSIGNNVSIGPGEHHKLRISSFPISSIVFNDFRSDDFILNKPSVIGNDVWIGKYCNNKRR